MPNSTMQAVEALWQTSNDLAKLLPRGLESGVIKNTPDKPLDIPYAHLGVTQEKPAKRYTGAARLDYKKVSIVVYGWKPDVTAVLSAALKLFNDQLGAPGRPTLSYPDPKFKFVAWWPQVEGLLSQTDQTREGRDVWKGTIEGEVRSSRPSPGGP